jgi:hypothetical protein
MSGVPQFVGRGREDSGCDYPRDRMGLILTVGVGGEIYTYDEIVHSHTHAQHVKVVNPTEAALCVSPRSGSWS